MQINTLYTCAAMRTEPKKKKKLYSIRVSYLYDAIVLMNV